MDNEPHSDQPTSKFNGGIAQLIRLDLLWQKAHNFAMDGRLKKWNWVLDMIWCELGADFKENSDEEKEMLKINSDIIKFQNLPNALYQVVMKKELYLRRLQNKVKKGTAMDDGDDEELD